MTSSDANRELKPGHFGLEEAILRLQALHNATHAYSDALNLEAFAGGYVNDSVVETPVPTKFFRMDSKTQYLGNDGGLRRHKIFVYVPRDTDPEVFLTHFWIKHEQPNGVQAMFEVSETGAGSYMRPHEVEADLEDMAVSLEFSDFEDVLVLDGVAEARRRSRTQSGLHQLNQALRQDTFEITPLKA